MKQGATTAIKGAAFHEAAAAATLLLNHRQAPVQTVLSGRAGLPDAGRAQSSPLPLTQR